MIDKAKVACENVNQSTSDHFIGVNKKVELGSGAQREIEDLMLTFFRILPTNLYQKKSLRKLGKHQRVILS